MHPPIPNTSVFPCQLSFNPCFLLIYHQGLTKETHMRQKYWKTSCHMHATTKLKTCDFVCQLIASLVCVCILITCSLVKCHTTWCGHADFRTCTSMCCSAMNGCMQSYPHAPCRLFSVTLKIHATTLRTGKQPGW